MASLACTCCQSARAAARQAYCHARFRGYRTTSRSLAAQNFAMPALSPTMTEGNISGWKVKEGDSFAAGDVILEVETDKATMDVEAQDDGILAKIMQPDGAKSVPVGSRIAVLAEPGDDVSTLEIPPDNSKPTNPAEKDEKESSPSQAEAPPSSKAAAENAAPEVTKAKKSGDKAASSKDSKQEKPSTSKTSSSSKSSKSTTQNKKYPLYPSVYVLLHQNNLSAGDITATGPNGRLLKGDVLAHLEQIPKSYPEELSSKLEHRTHLDLSNIKSAPAKEKKAEKKEAAAKPAEAIPVSVTMPISLTAVLNVQKRMQESLGITLPLSAFVTRAIDLANEDLPKRGGPPSADELFDAVVGGRGSKGRRATRGHFVPRIVALPPPMLGASSTRSKTARRPRDVLDELTAPPASVRRDIAVVRRQGAIGALSGADNIFSLKVEEGEAKRARVFLDRVKTVLEVEPGRLVL